MSDEVSVLNSWKNRLNKFFHELQAEGWIMDDDNEITLVYSSMMYPSGQFPFENISKMKELDPLLRPAEITMRLRAHLPLKGD